MNPRGSNQKSLVTILAVALLVAIAGCNGVGSADGAQQGETASFQDQATSTQDQDRAASTSNAESNSVSQSDDQASGYEAPTEGSNGDDSAGSNPPTVFPVGTSADGITDAADLVAAHIGALEGTSYTLSRTETYTADEYTYAVDTLFARQGAEQLFTADYTGQLQEIYQADNGSPNYIRWETENGVRYLVDEGDVLFPGETAFFIQSILEAGTFEFVEQRTIDDQPVYVFSVTDFRSTQDLQDASPLESIEHLEGAIFVTGDGLVVGLDIILVGPDFEEVVTELHINQAFSKVGTTDITAPSWLEEAEDHAVMMSASLDEDRNFIAVTMERGDTIPAGSRSFIYVGDTPIETVFADGITPGQTFYIFETSGGELTVTMNKPASSNVGTPVPEDLHEVSVAIFHEEYGTVYATTLHLETPEHQH